MSALLLTGCISQTTDPEPTATVDPGKVSPTDLPEVPEVEDSQGAIADASFGECPPSAGAQSVEGTITNSTDEPADYVVTVSWITDTSDVRARGVAVVEDAEPGEAAPFTVEAEVPEGVASCTFLVVRGTLP